MSDWKPVGRSDVRSRQQGEELALADPENSKVHFLNETAEFIWELCDGDHTLMDIEMEIRSCFDVPPEADIRADIERTLVSLDKKGLLEPRGH
jgi:Coenzyme PQQ synthesis protein D (PqqD)